MHYLLSPYSYDLSDPESIPNLILQHAFLVGVSMLISLIIAIPIGVLIARHPKLSTTVITFAGVLYTIPATWRADYDPRPWSEPANSHHSACALCSIGADPQHCSRD